MELYCSYDQTEHNIGGYDPEDSWSRDSYSGDYWVTGVYLTGGMRDSVESNEDIKAGDLVYVTYAVYTTGDTFGSDGGRGCIVAVSKNYDIAIQAEKWCNNTPIDPIQIPWPPSLPEISYRPWDGYFEYLDSVRTESFVVQ